MRDNFNSKTKDILAKRVGYLCSNPKCKKLTCGPQEEPTRVVNIGVGAHITAASPNGPRYDFSLSSEERKHISNGIWLCQNCAKLIDNNPKTYSLSKLYRWKIEAENYAKTLVEQNVSTDYNWENSLSKQLTTFSRVPFSFPIFSLKKSKVSFELLMKSLSATLFEMIGCSYIDNFDLTRRDNFSFALTLNFDQENDDRIYLSGELITHLTPFAYRFGILAEQLRKGDIDGVYSKMEKFPSIKIRRRMAFGEFIPYRISRMNPSELFIEIAAKKVYEFNGKISTNDLIYYFSAGARGNLVLFDDQNEVDEANKILRLMDETMDGFNLTEIWINPDNPEEWDFN